MWEDLEPEKKAAPPPESTPTAEPWGGLEQPTPPAGAWGGIGADAAASVPAWGGSPAGNFSSAFQANEASNSFSNLLHQSIQQSMEEMVFLPVEKRTMLVAVLAVLEPIRGTLQFVMSQKQAHDIAVAMHACEPGDLTEQMTCDSVAELINTVAGQLASSLLPSDQTFTLGLPVVCFDGHVEHSEPTRAVFLEVVDEIFQLVVSGQELLALCDVASERRASEG